MKPDKPGEWHSRDGRKIVTYYGHDGAFLFRSIGVADSCDIGFVAYLNSDDWLPAVAPTFPELPARPPETQPTFWCCCRMIICGSECIRWRGFRRGQHCAVDEHGYGQRPVAEYEIVSHPDNDPEAEEIIRTARELQ